MPQRGFTLLEMLAVILLISLAVGLLGLGARQAVQAANERRVVGQMVDALRTTRAGAIVSGRAARTEFDLQRLTFQAPGRAPHAWPPSLRVTLHSAEQIGRAHV